MTIRRLNYTGRQRIGRDSIAISLVADAATPSFEAAVDLSGYDFPPDAGVVVEAGADWTVMRFPWGTVGTPPDSMIGELAEFAVPDGVRFTVKVLGSGEQAGLILGEASGIVPSAPETVRAGRSFVDVRPTALGDVAWKLVVDESHPILLVNSSVGDWKAFVRTTAFRALVAPEVFRQLIAAAADADVDVDGDDPPRTWETQCLSLAAQASQQSLPVPLDANTKAEWIDTAVGAFARRHRLGSALASFVSED